MVRSATTARSGPAEPGSDHAVCGGAGDAARCGLVGARGAAWWARDARRLGAHARGGWVGTRGAALEPTAFAQAITGRTG